MTKPAPRRHLVDQAASLAHDARARIEASRAIIIDIMHLLRRSRKQMEISRRLLADKDGGSMPAFAEPAGGMRTGSAFDLFRDNLARHHWRGLAAISGSGASFEPLARYPGVGRRIAGWLQERGLVEGRPESRYRHLGLCYRATALGRQVLKRGRHAPAGLRQGTSSD